VIGKHKSQIKKNFEPAANLITSSMLKNVGKTKLRMKRNGKKTVGIGKGTKNKDEERNTTNG